jgi:hypothetical protein
VQECSRLLGERSETLKAFHRMAKNNATPETPETSCSQALRLVRFRGCALEDEKIVYQACSFSRWNCLGEHPVAFVNAVLKALEDWNPIANAISPMVVVPYLS